MIDATAFIKYRIIIPVGDTLSAKDTIITSEKQSLLFLDTISGKV